jgi:nucleoside-diphosphate-sugar epimerase
MRVLVTGATGFVGRRLVPRLVSAGHEVTVLVRAVPRLGDLRELPVRIVEGDLTTGAGLVAAMADVDCVVHLAAAVKSHSGAGYHAVNVEGTRRICEAAAGSARPPFLVYCSSLTAAGPSAPGRPHREEDEPRPMSHYGRSKLRAEAVLAEFAVRLRTVVVRPPIVYGPGDTEFVERLAALVGRGLLPTVLATDTRYSLIYVDDLCDLLVLAACRGVEHTDWTGRVYYVSDGVEHTYTSIGGEMARVLGRPAPRIARIPYAAMLLVTLTSMAWARVRRKPTMLNLDKLGEIRCPSWTCSSERVLEDFGFRAKVSLGDGFTEALGGRSTRPFGAQQEKTTPRQNRGVSS